MKRKLSAIIYTLIFVLECLASPIFYMWYEKLLRVCGVEFTMTPFIPFLCVIFIFIGQTFLLVYLWMRAFDNTLK